MIKMIVSFLAAWGAIAFGIYCWRQLNSKEKWSATKLAAYAAVTAILAATILTGIVLLF